MTPSDMVMGGFTLAMAVASVYLTIAFIRHLTADDRNYRKSLRKDRS